MATNTNPIPTKFTKGLAISNKTDSLLTTEQGTVVVNPTTNKAEVYSGGAFRVLADDSQVVKITGAQSIDGSLAVTGNVSMANPTQPLHGVNKQWFELNQRSFVANVYTFSGSSYVVDSRTNNGQVIPDYYIHYTGNSGTDVIIYLPDAANSFTGRTICITKGSQVTPLKVSRSQSVPNPRIDVRGTGFDIYTISWGITLYYTGSTWRAISELV